MRSAQLVAPKRHSQLGKSMPRKLQRPDTPKNRRRKAKVQAPPIDPLAAARAKLKELEALKKKVKAAMGPAAEPKKKRPRFSGSWGCGA
jgi:hypothetical protein